MINPVKITPAAIHEINHILNKKGIPKGYCLRLGVKGGHGCAGVNYSLGFDKKKNDDVSYQIENITVLIQKAELMFMVGKVVDFYEGSDARGFVFQNQAESSTTAL
jgi:iron-sulfur cluster assembly protein